MALVSPWGELRTTATSYKQKQFKDSVNATVFAKWAAYFLGNAELDGYNNPFQVSPEWWENLAGCVESVLVTAGGDEVCVDDIRKFADTLEVKVVAGDFDSDLF